MSLFATRTSSNGQVTNEPLSLGTSIMTARQAAATDGGGGNATANVSTTSEGEAVGPVGPVPEPEPPVTPIYKKWWFWGLIAGGVAGGAYAYKRSR